MELTEIYILIRSFIWQNLEESINRESSQNETKNHFFGQSLAISPPKKICVICLTESLLKMMKNPFYFILKGLFVLKIPKFLYRLFGHAGKKA